MPFSKDELFTVFASLNAAAWPYWILAYPVGLAILALCLRGTDRGLRISLGLLGVLWIVCGAGFHGIFFAQINPAAPGFALGFVLQGGLMIAFACTTDVARNDGCAIETTLSLAIAVFGLAAYPLLGLAFGRSYFEIPIFGLAPSPTVIFTLGVLMLMTGRGMNSLFVVPLLWAAIGGTTALLLGVAEDYGLIGATGIVAAILLSQGKVAHRWSPA